MTRFPKIVALLALGMATGCRDSYPVSQPPPSILYYPVGMAVRQLAPSASAPYGSSQLVVVNSNFDIRYDEQTGGTVMVVDPDKSGETQLGGDLAVLGFMRVGSFGGEVAMVDGRCPVAWPDCPTACPQLLVDPAIDAGGARVIMASRSAQTIYQFAMGADGSLACGANCTYLLPNDRLDPYGVTAACSRDGVNQTAQVYLSHLVQGNGLGWLTRVNLLDGSDVVGLILGDNPTYTSVFNPQDNLLFTSSSIPINGQFRWFNPGVAVNVVGGIGVPDYRGPTFSNFLPGAVARDMAVSSDGLRLYVTVQIYDLALAVRTGIFTVLGGGLAVFDLTPSAFVEPRMSLLGIERTCVGVGQIRRLPARTGKPDLFAITCDVDGGLAIYDADARRVVQFVGLDPTSGLPRLGLGPFGLAVEPIDLRRATPYVAGLGYTPSPCQPDPDKPEKVCQRVYVGSFLQNWINVLEMDPDQPTQIALVKRIGRGP